MNAAPTTDPATGSTAAPAAPEPVPAAGPGTTSTTPAATPIAEPVTLPPSAPPQTPGEALGLLATRRATGALHGPLGSLHLVDGRVTHADSPRAPGLADLLTGCGRIAPADWAELLRAHGPHARVGEAMVDRGLIGRGELELGHLGTLFDAAFFVLADQAGGTWRFEHEARHWLGPVAEVDADRLRREVDRRSGLLDQIWPWGRLDTAPVRPAVAGFHAHRRPPGRRQRELLDHADGRRTPADLARLLGRSGFGVTADVRRLAAAGLLDAGLLDVPRHAAPRAAPPGAPGVPLAAPLGARAGVTPAAPAVFPPAPSQAGPLAPPLASPPLASPPLASPPLASPALASPPAPPLAAPLAPPPVGAPTVPPLPASEAPSPPRRSGGLHRRVPGATLTGVGILPGATPPGSVAADRPAHPPTTAAAHPLTVPDPDIALLTRVRTLLEARL
ncbi:hypothetical protein ACIRS1_14660 [Kitasatospora sp. NPDC101176]|uniref:hypothetical protein n=1 Tax=Kitasatospora sp. NPDC101176 TaxID=3364099 RepID=UPI003810B2E9